jgi:hypothetical protein
MSRGRILRNGAPGAGVHCGGDIYQVNLRIASPQYGRARAMMNLLLRAAAGEQPGAVRGLPGAGRTVSAFDFAECFLSISGGLDLHATDQRNSTATRGCECR